MLDIVTKAPLAFKPIIGVVDEIKAGTISAPDALRNIFDRALVAESHARMGIDSLEQMTQRVGTLVVDLRELMTKQPDHEKLGLPLKYAIDAAANVQNPRLASELEGLTASLKPAIDEARAKAPQRPIEFGPGEPRTEGHSPFQGMDDADVAEGVRRSPGTNANPNVDSLGNEPRDYSPGSAFDGSDSADLF